MLRNAWMSAIMRKPKAFNNCLGFEPVFLVASNKAFYRRAKKDGSGNTAQVPQYGSCAADLPIYC